MDEEERNYCCLVLLLSRVGVERLRPYFINQWNSVGSFVPWTNCARNGTDLLTKFKPLPYEKDKVKSGDTSRWDLSLFVKALLHTKPPFVTNKSSVSSLECLKETRNKLCHSPDGKIETAEFKKLWSSACNALVMIGGTSTDFQKVKQDVKQPWNEMMALVKQCAKQDEDILRGIETINSRLDKLQQGQKEIKEGQSGLQEELKQGQEQIRKEISDLKHQSASSTSTSTSQGSHFSAEDVQVRSNYLKASTKRQTEYQPKFMASDAVSSARTDEIFTNLLMQHGRKPLPKGEDASSRPDHLGDYSKLSGTPIERSQDIFITQEDDKPNPKSILVTGKAGIGKTLFCQKLLRDWTEDVLFQAEPKKCTFDFVYLLNFRELNLLGNRRFTLREVLNRYSLMDEHSNIDEVLFEYIIDHPEKVLFILDGYDEYAHPENISSEVEQKYENNPRIRMPVSALLSKLFSKKIFGDSVLMVTTRPTEVHKLGGVHFHTLVEIAGFSPQQVKEFIGKYFCSNNKMKSDVLEHIMKNENLLSLAHIPMLCFLICWCMEWHIETKTDKGFPVTMTELYSEVVEIFELKHHSKSEYRSEQLPQQFEVPNVVKKAMMKLSKLAAVTIKEKKLLFEEEDFKKFDLSSEEIENLKVSGLLTCGPGFRKTPTKITRHYCFSHLTLHEYFSARWYVENKEIPKLQEVESEMVFQFMAGLSASEKCEVFMEKLLLSVPTQIVLFPSLCLYEYNDIEFAVRMIKKYYSKCLFCDRKGALVCSIRNDYSLMPKEMAMSKRECEALSFFLDALSLFSKDKTPEECKVSSSQPVIINELIIGFGLPREGIQQICKSLKNRFCPIISLVLLMEVIDDNILGCFGEELPSTNISRLHLGCCSVRSKGLQSLSTVLVHPDCKVKTIELYCNRYITDDDVKSFLALLKRKKPDLHVVYVPLTSLFAIRSKYINIAQVKHVKK